MTTPAGISPTSKPSTRASSAPPVAPARSRPRPTSRGRPGSSAPSGPSARERPENRRDALIPLSPYRINERLQAPAERAGLGGRLVALPAGAGLCRGPPRVRPGPDRRPARPPPPSRRRSLTDDLQHACAAHPLERRDQRDRTCSALLTSRSGSCPREHAGEGRRGTTSGGSAIDSAMLTAGDRLLPQEPRTDENRLIWWDHPRRPGSRVPRRYPRGAPGRPQEPPGRARTACAWSRSVRTAADVGLHFGALRPSGTRTLAGEPPDVLRARLVRSVCRDSPRPAVRPAARTRRRRRSLPTRCAASPASTPRNRARRRARRGELMLAARDRRRRGRGLESAATAARRARGDAPTPKGRSRVVENWIPSESIPETTRSGIA